MKRTPFLLLVLLLALALLGLGLFWVGSAFQNVQKQNQTLTAQLATAEVKNDTLTQELNQPTPTPSSTLPPIPIPTPVPTIFITNTAHQLAAEALIQLQDHFDVALLLAVEAYQLADTPTTRGVLLQTLEHNPQLKAILPEQNWGWPESLVFSPDGRFLATADSSQGQATLFDLHQEPLTAQILTGLPIFTQYHAPTARLAFSPDSQFLAGIYPGKNDETHHSLVVWNVLTHEIVATSPEQFVEVAFLADSYHLITRSYEVMVHWEIQGQTLQEIARYPLVFPIVAQVIHPTENKVIWVHQAGLLEVWDPFENKIVDSFTPLPGREIAGLAYHPAGSFIAIVSGYDLLLWDTTTQQTVASMRPVLPDLAFSQDGETLLVVNPDQSLQLLTVPDLKPAGEPLQRWGGLRSLIAVALHPDGDLIASGYKTSKVLLWSAGATSRLATELASSEGYYFPVTFIDDTTLAVWERVYGEAGVETKLGIWDITTSQPLTQTIGFSDIVLPREMTFNQDYTIAVGYNFSYTLEMGFISWFNPLTNEPLTPQITHTNRLYDIALNPAGSLLVAREETKLNLWNHTGEIIDELATPPQKLLEASLFFSPDGQLLLVSGITQTMVVEMATFQLQHTLNTEGVTQWAFHPTEPRLMGYGNAQIYKWDLQTGLLLSQRPFFAGNYEEQLEETLTRWLFNFHGRVAASTHSERRDYDAGYSYLRLYDTQTLLPIGPELTGWGGYWGIAINPSGTFLATTSGGPVILWPLEVEEWVKKACYTVNRNFTEEEWQLYFGNQPYRLTCPQFPRP